MSDETHEERIARMRRLAAEGKIELASQFGVDQYEAEVDEILALLGHPEALVTDLSALSDFGPRKARRVAAALAERLGGPIAEKDLIVVLAARLRGARDLEEGVPS